MPFDLRSPPYREPAECVVRVRGQPIAALYPFLTEVRVECSRDEASVAALTFATRRDERGRWAVQDERVLVPWEPVVIEAAFGHRTEEVMRGYVRDVRAAYPADAAGATVTVACQDESLALDRTHVRAVWGADAATSDDVVVRAIAARHGLRVDPESGPGLAGLVLHQDATDVRFLRARAEANGYELLVREGTIYFGPMRLDAEPQPSIRVHAGADTNCLSLAVTADGHQPTRIAVDVASVDGAGSRRREVAPDLRVLGLTPAAAGGEELGEFTWLLSREGSYDEDELVARAQKRANDFAMRVKAEGELDGSLYGHVLQVGAPVAIDGVGEWLGGHYYVDRVTHVFSAEGYRQSIRLLRNAYGDDLDAGPVSALAGIL